MNAHLGVAIDLILIGEANKASKGATMSVKKEVNQKEVASFVFSVADHITSIAAHMSSAISVLDTDI